jgi:hypothetical protein
MMEKDRNLWRVLMMAGIFRLDHDRWPRDAAELAAFVEQKGWALDFSAYHTLTFTTGPWKGLLVEVSKRSEGDWLSVERIEVEPSFFEKSPEPSVPLRIRSEELPPRKIKERSYCSLSA